VSGARLALAAFEALRPKGADGGAPPPAARAPPLLRRLFGLLAHLLQSESTPPAAVGFGVGALSLCAAADLGAVRRAVSRPSVLGAALMRRGEVALALALFDFCEPPASRQPGGGAAEANRLLAELPAVARRRWGGDALVEALQAE
jgi:hypothetical protein